MAFLKQNLINSFLALLAIVLLLFCGFKGFNRAKFEQQSKVAFKNASMVRQGLQFFFNDYGRFPKALEFENSLAMRDYFSDFPPKDFAFENCGKSWLYARPTAFNYEFSFCLGESVNGLSRDWYKFSSNAEFK